MKLGIMQPYTLPYIGYYQLMCQCDKIVFLDDVNFIKKGYIHRNNILCNKTKKLFTIPIKNASQNTLIKDIYLFDFKKNCNIFLKKIKHCYNNAKYFSEVFNLINNIFNETFENKPISCLAVNSIIEVLKYLDIELDYTLSSNLPIIQGKGEERIINICKHFNADVYINLAGGKKLYNKLNFKKENINLLFQEPYRFIYTQFEKHTPFVPSLSIIDVLMFNDKETIKQTLYNQKGYN